MTEVRNFDRLPTLSNRRATHSQVNRERGAYIMRAAITAIGLLLVAPIAARAGTMTLAWDQSPPGVNGYRVYYGTSSGVYDSLIEVGNVTTYAVTGLAIDRKYYFAVTAYSADGISGYSNEVSGYPGFTDSTLTAGVTFIQAVHITELRARINNLRTLNGLTAQAWTGSALGAGAVIGAVHVNEMRSALNAVYTKLSQALPVYTDSTLIVGVTPMKAAHIMELRQAVKALE